MGKITTFKPEPIQYLQTLELALETLHMLRGLAFTGSKLPFEYSKEKAKADLADLWLRNAIDWSKDSEER